MKTRVFLIITALLSLSVALHAADGIGVTEASVKPGEEVELKVFISQETRKYVGIQFDIEIDNGLSIVSYAVSGGQSNDPVGDIESIGANVYRFMVYSNSLSAFKNGDVLALRVKAGSGMACGEYMMTVSNVILSDEKGNTLKPADRNYSIRVVADYQEENVSLESCAIIMGETEDVGLSIAQRQERYSGLQFDMTLPEGLSLVVGLDGQPYTLSGSQPDDIECEVETIGSNSYRLLVYSNSLVPMKSGEVLKLHVKAKSGMEQKSYSLLLSQILLSDADGQVTKLNNRVTTIKVTESFTMKGDLNVDGDVDVTDVVELIDMVLAGIYDAAGDINGDGEVDVTDVVELIDMVLSGE